MQISMGTFIAIACQGEVGAGAATNDVLPSHDYVAPLTPVIDTEITGVAGTWSNADSITHQWQKALTDAGPWSDVTGATSINYTPLDADGVFGYVLRRRETAEPGGVTAESAATGAVATTTFTETRSGTNALTGNGDMETGNPPTGWTATNATLAGVADERTGGAGIQSLEVTNTGSQFAIATRTVAGEASFEWYEVEAWWKNVNANLGASLIHVTSGQTLSTAGYTGTSWAPVGSLLWVRSASMSVQVAARGSNTETARFDDVGAYKKTLNTTHNAPSADMQVEAAVTLPGTPYAGQRLMMLYRIQGSLATELNFYAAIFDRNGQNTEWSVSLVKVIAGVISALGSATNIGSFDAVRAVCYGTTHAVYIRSGGTWDIVIDELTDSQFSTGTGVNIVTNTVNGERISVDSFVASASVPFDQGLTGSSILFVDGDSKSDPAVAYSQWPFIFRYYAQQETGTNWDTTYNLATSGDTVASALADLPASLAALDDSPAPALALLNFGANDVNAVGTLVEATWKQGLRDYIDTLRAKWTDIPIRLALPWREANTEVDDLCDWITEVAAEYTGVGIGHDERDWFATDATLWYSGQGVHYNHYRGCRECAKQWIAALYP